MGLHIRGKNHNWSAGGKIPANATFPVDGRTLHVRGIVLDTVETLGQPLNLNEIENQEQAKRQATCEIFLQWWNLYSQLCGPSLALASQDLFERTVFGGSWSAAGELDAQYRLP